MLVVDHPLGRAVGKLAQRDVLPAVVGDAKDFVGPAMKLDLARLLVRRREALIVVQSPGPDGRLARHARRAADLFQALSVGEAATYLVRNLQRVSRRAAG